jgi:hypothetical protein
MSSNNDDDRSDGLSSEVLRPAKKVKVEEEVVSSYVTWVGDRSDIPEEPEDEEDKEEDVEEEEDAGEPPAVRCVLCDNSPCILRQGLYDDLVLLSINMTENSYETVYTNKQVHFEMYREATRYIHGYLGKGRGVPLPQCVRTEILDFAPESDRKYVGFQDGETKEEE